MRSRVLVVETVDICHKEEIVCLHHGCGDGGEGVVVTEFLDLANFLGVIQQVLVWKILFASRTETARVSFSLTIGITPIFRSSVKVFCAFRYCVRCSLVSVPYLRMMSHT